MTLKFSFDTSALIEAWHRRLPHDVVPSYWSKLEGLIEQGEVGCIDAVKRELEAESDELLEWFKAQKKIVRVTTPEVVQAVQSIMGRFPSLVRSRSSRDAADPFVIALAQVHRATVVTEELPAGDQAKRVKMPNVCRALGVQCIDVYGFARVQEWRF